MRRLKPKTAATPLRFGSLIHKAMEGYYIVGKQRGPHPARIFEQAYELELKEQVRMGFKDEDRKWHEAGELGVSMLEHYIDTYGADDEYEVLAVEQRFESPIVSSRGNLIGIYIGVLDKLMRYLPKRTLEIWDHKSAKSISTSHLLLDSQKSAYWTYGVDWLLKHGILKDTRGLDRITFNFVRKAKRDERAWRHGEKGKKVYLNKDGTDSKVQPSEFFVRHPVPMSEGSRELQRMMVEGELRDIKLTRAGKLDIYKNPGMFNCMGCDVKDVCELHEVGGDFEELARLTMVPKGEWDPIEYKQEAVTYELEH